MSIIAAIVQISINVTNIILKRINKLQTIIWVITPLHYKTRENCLIIRFSCLVYLFMLSKYQLLCFIIPLHLSVFINDSDTITFLLILFYSFANENVLFVDSWIPLYLAKLVWCWPYPNIPFLLSLRSLREKTACRDHSPPPLHIQFSLFALSFRFDENIQPKTNGPS